MKKWIFRFAVASLMLFCCNSIFAETEKTKVRVGFFEFDGYHQIDNNGTKFGYGYDFLQMIAPYAGFEYEYVGYQLSWGEMQEMVVNGNIDLLTSAQKTPAREEIFDYSNRSIGYSSTIVTTNPVNTHLLNKDLSAIKNLKVGMIKNNSRNASFERYAKRNGITYTPVVFKDHIAMAKAMEERTIDLMVTSDLRTLGNEVVIAKFDDSPFYAVVKDGNSELLKKLNFAIEMLSLDSPNWMHMLSNKYYGNTHAGNDIVLTDEEKEYFNGLKQRGETFKVLFNPDRAPYSYMERGKAKGIFVDLFEKIAANLGIEYEIISCETVKDYERIIRSGTANIIFGTVIDYATAEDMAYSLTNSFHTTSIAKVTRQKETSAKHRVAVNEGMSFLNKNYLKFYGNENLLKFRTVKECMEAVKKGKADCCYVYIYTAAKYVYEDAKGILAYSPVNESVTNCAIAVHDSDGLVLYHLMNRISGNITEDEIQTAVADNTNFNYEGNIFVYLIYKRTLFTLFAVISVLLFGFAMFMRRRDRERKMNKILLKEGLEKRQALELACEAAEKANKAKSDFLSKMSHDIRTPMNAIVGMTAIAQANITNTEKVDDCLSKINSSGQHLLALINDVLDMSKIESGTFSLSYEEFNLRNILDELAEIVSSEIKVHNHNFKINYENIQHENVIGDALRIQQVFVNITGNAIKYTPDGGKIEVFARELESNQPRIGIYEFIFKDNGIGMSKEFMQTIFNPFSREKDSRVDKIHGTGLGLAITKNIITMMDGSIDVESEQNKGSTFKIILKLKLQNTSINPDHFDSNDKKSDSPHDKKHSSLSELNALDFKGKKILLVEDNEINREIACEILAMTGVEIVEAENGKVALEKFSESAEGEYDIIFMDIQMPLMNGYEVTLAIRGLERNDAKTVPIIAMTANAFTEDIEKSRQSGMNDHIAKPLNMKKLVSVLEEYLGS